MESILTRINSLQQHQWDYYSELDPASHLSNPFNGLEISHQEFIRKYFIRSGKEKVMLEHFNIQEALKNHSAHTNSIFFLGCLLYYNTKIFDKIFPGEFNPAKYHVFPFLWFLSCLFHDLAYEYETSKTNLAKISDINSLKKEFKVQHDLLQQNPPQVSQVLFDAIPNYFLYRRSNDKIDHGILAGLHLFNKLVKNRRIKSKEASSSLYWGEDLEQQYAIAGATIATHNIWVNQKEHSDAYIKFGLTALTNFAPLKLDDFPFLYLLGIVDTIDPVKALSNDKFDPKYVLENINIDVEQDKIVFSNGKESELDFKQLLKKADSFDQWLDVGVIKDENILKLELR